VSKFTKIISVVALAGAVHFVASSTAEAQPRRGQRGSGRVIVAAPYYSPWFYNGWYAPIGYPYPPYGYAAYDRSASLRVEVEPREGEVFVDGYYAGVVDDFDGMFQRLRVEPGEHEIQLYLQGYRSFRQRVYLQPGRTFRIRHTMAPLGPADVPEERPAASAPLAAPGGVVGGPAPGARPIDRRRGAAPPNGVAGDAGSIVLRVQPADAEVFVDGEPWQGSTGADRLVIQLPAGEHRIEIRKAGYASFQSTVRVRPGDTTPLNVSLTRE
jgi:hypothetical protein